jgi:lysophospholipase L1-like esterase
MNMKSFFLLLLPGIMFSQSLTISNPLRFLALGDSYTIGQNVSQNERWPEQLSDSLALRGITTQTLRTIATTGWRTDQLLNAIKAQNLQSQNYNLVSLLIGVNNQFQSVPFSVYKKEFIDLLDSAIRYAGGNPGHVFVLSIPDYYYTPAGQQIGNAQISTEIDQYNLYNKHVADSLQVPYFNVTPISRQGLNQPSYVANDGLHPSGQQYSLWVNLILQQVDQVILSGLKKNKGLNDFIVYPNPCRTVLYCTPNESFSYELLDLNQRVVINNPSYALHNEIDMAKIDPGIYYLRVIKKENTHYQKIVIVQ